jgi:hypothetical protein
MNRRGEWTRLLPLEVRKGPAVAIARRCSVPAAGLIACVFSVSAVAQSGTPTSLRAQQADRQQQHLRLVRSDPQAFLQTALRQCQEQVRDYTCLYITQQRLEGKVGKEQHVSVKLRAEPYSVFMKWLKNPVLAERPLYVKGRYDDMLLVKPSGISGLFVGSHVKRALDSRDAAKVSRRRIDEFGFAQILERICDVNAKAKEANQLTLRFDGVGQIRTRETYVIERHLPQERAYPDQRLVVHIDQEWLVPLAMWCYGADDQLLGRYEFHDVKLNLDLSPTEFTPEANGL